jgi:pimeloyl-ACP methyl ester carboxylesterase
MFTERTSPGEVPLHVASGPPAGPPLLLLHGATRRWQDFAPLLPALACRWQVHALDLRGHGRSGRAPGRYFVADHVRDVSGFVRTQLTQPVVVYGHSLGGLVALALAAEMPERVRGVVLEEPPGPSFVCGIGQTSYQAVFSGMRDLAGPGRDVPAVARALADLRLPWPGVGTVRLGDLRDATSLRFSARCLQDLDPDALTPLLEGRWLEGYDPEAVCRGVRCPALLLRADEARGGMLPRDDAVRLAGLMADCTLIDLPGAGHLLHWLETATVLRLVVGFLESL